MNEAAPPGYLGMLAGVLVVALLIGWRYRRRVPGSLVLWASIVVAAAAWWIEFRYLRYLFASAFAAAVVLLAVLGPLDLTPARVRLGAVAAVLAGTASLAVSLAMFWNVPNGRPPISVAIGRWTPANYLDQALPERFAFLAFDRLAPPDSILVTNAYERAWLTHGRDLYVTWELQALLTLHNLPATTGDSIFTSLRRIGVDWALVGSPLRTLSGAGLLPEVLRTHGQPRFSAGGWDLYQLVNRPSAPVPVSSCDRASHVSNCWAGERNGVGAGAPLARQVAVCPGQTLDVAVTQGASGLPSPVAITFPGASPYEAFAPSQTVPGATQPTYATVPAGAREASVAIYPVAGATITKATIGLYGPACEA
jgi:hypothetical protein